jgi:peptidoglycan/xylan/chitin deacetylase (PgdA/CDA1 family)
MRQKKIAVLTWHAYNLFGNTYETNDLIAFARDLQTIRSAGFAVVKLEDVARWVRGEIASLSDSDQPVVALSCDDGTDYDFLDQSHPEHGAQRAFATALREVRADGFHAHLTSFVIASPSARTQIANGAMRGQNALNDDWWRAANESDLIAIESHGWDHNHPTVSPVVQRDQRTGDFSFIDTFAECDMHVRGSANYIESRSGKRPTLFAYPWTQASDYMRREYMPQHAEAHGTIAAFGGQSDYISRDSDRWFLPRFVFGPDWRSDEGLLNILRGSLA